MDNKKVQAVVDLQAPHNVKDLRSFLGLTNYYTKFIDGLSKRAATLTDLLKKMLNRYGLYYMKKLFKIGRKLLHLNLY